jgi:hypothetical protein
VKKAIMGFMIVMIVVFSAGRTVFAAITPDYYDELLERTVAMINMHGLQVLGLHTERLGDIENTIHVWEINRLMQTSMNLLNYWTNPNVSSPLGIPNLWRPEGYLGWGGLFLTSASGLAYVADNITAYYGNSNIPVDQIISQVQLFRKLVMGNRYRQYFQVFEAGFWGNPHTTSAKAEFLYFIQCPSMTAFYELAGLSQNALNDLTSYENNVNSDNDLMYGLYLDNMSEVIDVVGAGWYASASIKRRFDAFGITVSMNDAHNFVLNHFDFVASLTPEELQTLFDLEEALLSEDIDILEIDKAVLEQILATSNDIGTYDIVRNVNSSYTQYGTALNNVIYGKPYMPNHILGLAGNDIIVGFGGDDILEGGSGSNYYIWYAGDGNDTISFSNTIASDTNTLVFGEYIDPNNISFEPNGDDLFIHYTSTDEDEEVTETITISNWFVSPENELTEIRFLGNFEPWSNSDINDKIDESFVGGLG